MAMRLSGINSGMDTDAMVQELVKAQSVKKDKLVKAQKSLEMKQDAWKTLNSKIYSFYNKSMADLRYAYSYAQKKTTVSNSSIASVITGSGAVNGVHSLKVDHLAKQGNLTGSKLASGTTGATKLSELDSSLDSDTDVKFTVTVDGTAKEITVNGDSTIDSVISQLNGAGVNASYDANNKRIFISSKTTGVDADFEISADDANGFAALSALGINYEQGQPGATKVDGENAKIYLNGADFESATNTFEINGLTITALSKSDEEITLSTTDDYDGIYDMLKKFITDYNALMKEMDSLYNAPSAKGYEPLTDEEKDAMSDSEIEKWEEKVSSAIMRKDEALGDISGAMRGIMLGGVEVNGKMMYLSDFGIETGGYFAEENERNLYHIDGDPDDSLRSSNENKLKAMISSDPQTVIDFFTGLTRNLYDAMGEKMAGSENRSFGKAYDDKLMQKEYDDYTKKISEQQERLTRLEDKYYRQFTAMEVALSKLTKSQSAITSLLGG